MTPEEFIKLKSGDKLRYNDQEFHIQFIEKAVWPESGVEGTSVVFNNQGQSIRLGDKIIDKLVLVSEPAAKHMVRIELVISGIDPNSSGFGFMEEAVESAIEDYGGEVTEYNVVNQ